MGRMIVCAFFSVCLIAWLTLTQSVRADVVTVDIGQFPDGTTVPANEVITDEYRDIGILFAGRQSVTNTDPISLFIGGSGPDADNRFLFNTPDVFGAVYEFTFVEPGTTTPTGATFFQISPDFDSTTESVEVVGFDLADEVVASRTGNWTNNGQSPLLSITPPAGEWFTTVEVRTQGNPGIGFLGRNPDGLQFTLVPEPATAALLGLGGLTLLRRNKNLKERN